MTTTPKLGIPLISSQQSQPEVTHNTMVVLLQALAGGAIGEQNAPPGSPAEGDCYIVGSAPSGAWIGHTHAIAIYFGGWNYIPGYDDDGVIIPMTSAQNGLSIFNNNTGELWAWQTSSWIVVTGGTGASRLIDLLDVSVSETATEDGDALVWDQGAGVWVARAITPGAAALQDLTDVNVGDTSTEDGDVLTWDQASGKWVAMPLSIPSSGGGGVTRLDQLDDVAVGDTSTEDGDVLTWNDSAQRWQAQPAGISKALTSGHILVGNVSNIAANVALSGDATLSNVGAITVTKSNNVAFGSAAFVSTAAFDAAGAAAAAQAAAIAASDPVGTAAAVAALRASSAVFGLAKVDNTTITAAGGVLSAIAALPAAKYFLATLSADQAAAGWTKLICDSFVSNTLGTQYAVGTGKFTPTTAGLWAFFAVTRMKAASSASSHAISITKNGTWSGSGTQLLIVNSQNGGGATTPIIEGVMFAPMNGSTDWVEIDGILSISSGGSDAFVGTQCFFGAIYLGP